MIRVFAFAVVLVTFWAVNVSASYPAYCKLAEKVQEADMKSFVAKTLADRPRRHDVNSGRDKAAAALEIKNAFTAALGGSNVEDVTMSYKSTAGVHILGRKEGKAASAARKIYIVAAHYDTQSSGTPGAMDNGCGVAALLEMVKYLGKDTVNYEHTLVFIAFDFEEDGCCPPQGSGAFLAKVGGGGVTLFPAADVAKIAGMFSLDALGQFSDVDGSQTVPTSVKLGMGIHLFPQLKSHIDQHASGNVANLRGDFLAVITNEDAASLLLSTAMTDVLSNCGYNSWKNLANPYFDVVPIVAPHQSLTATAPTGVATVAGICAVPGLGDLCRSDHASFWNLGVPAVHVTDTGNFRCPTACSTKSTVYHTADDNTGTMGPSNWQFLYRSTKVTAAAVAKLAGVRSNTVSLMETRQAWRRKFGSMRTLADADVQQNSAV